MNLNAVLTDLDGRPIEFLDDETFTITARVLGHGEAEVALGRGSGIAAKLDVARCAVQVYEDATLRFFGKVWEPLSIGSGGITLPARGPLAEFLGRYAQAQKDYTSTNNAGGPWDAGQIAFDRLAIQNARRNTYLRAGTRAASVNRVRTVLPGTQEKDIIDELASAAGGFFYREAPVAGVSGVMADFDILYPDSGAERPEIAFGWGENTVDNCADYAFVKYLPRNFITAASSASSGGRIAKAAQDAASIAAYGLFEEQTTWNDVTDATLLQQQADSSVKPEPPVTIELVAGADAPLLFRDFGVGDFVRVHVVDGGLEVLEWARVLEATLRKTEAGVVLLDNVSVELVVGGAVTVAPSRLWRERMDENRRRIEALERRTQNISQTQVAAPAPPPPSEPGGGDGTPAEPTAPPPPPPAAPAAPPTISVAANGVNYTSDGALIRGVDVTVTVDMKGQPGSVSIDVGGSGASLGGSGTVFVAKDPGTYAVNATVTTPSGSASAGTSATVPAVTAA